MHSARIVSTLLVLAVAAAVFTTGVLEGVGMKPVSTQRKGLTGYYKTSNAAMRSSPPSNATSVLQDVHAAAGSFVQAEAAQHASITGHSSTQRTRNSTLHRQRNNGNAASGSIILQTGDSSMQTPLAGDSSDAAAAVGSYNVSILSTVQLSDKSSVINKATQNSNVIAQPSVDGMAIHTDVETSAPSTSTSTSSGTTKMADEAIAQQEQQKQQQQQQQQEEEEEAEKGPEQQLNGQYPSVAAAQQIQEGQQQQQQPEIVYLHLGHLAQYQALGALHARRANPNTKVTVILHKDSDAKAWRDLAEHTGINVYIPSDWSLVDRFKGMYLHSSVNGVKFESFCIYRHLMLWQYMKEKNVSSALNLDLDIVLFDDVFKVLPAGTTLTPISTFAIHWTRDTMEAFADYVMKFYSRSKLEVAQHIHSVGKPGDSLNKRLYRSSEISAWWPQDIPRRHISDMRLFKSFVDAMAANSSSKAKSLRVLCTGNVQSPCSATLDLMRNLKHRPRPQGDADKLSPLLQVYNSFEWRRHPEFGYYQPLMNGTVVPAIHFQAQAKKLMPGLLCRNLLDYFGAETRFLLVVKGFCAGKSAVPPVAGGEVHEQVH